MTSISALNQQYAGVAGVHFSDTGALYPELGGALPVLMIANPQGRCVVSLYGAHVLSFVPAGKNDLLWLSPKAIFEDGKPIRGGIPLCLPWFSEHPQGFPMHGFARLSHWSVETIEQLADESHRVVLTLSDSESTRAMWPHEFVFRMELLVGAELKMTLTVENRSQTDAPLSFAFHSYFNVGDVREAVVDGLDACRYLDKPDNRTMKQQVGALQLKAFTDSVYYEVPKTQSISSPAGPIGIDADSGCCVVWNAWEKDAGIADIGEGNARGYLCVERGEVFERALTIPAGGVYRSTMTLS